MLSYMAETRCACTRTPSRSIKPRSLTHSLRLTPSHSVSLRLTPSHSISLTLTHSRVLTPSLGSYFLLFFFISLAGRVDNLLGGVWRLIYSGITAPALRALDRVLVHLLDVLREPRLLRRAGARPSYLSSVHVSLAHLLAIDLGGGVQLELLAPPRPALHTWRFILYGADIDG